MSKRGRKREKIGRNVLTRCVVICFAAAIISSLTIPGLAALQAEDTVTVTVNAPAYVEEPFNVTIDVDSITDFNSGQFDLSFNSSVVNVTDVESGSVDGATVPVDRWEFVDADTIRVVLDVPGITGISGSGNLARIRFEVVGESGDRSALDISEGLLVDTDAEEIPAEWIDDEVTAGLTSVKVEVNAPRYVKESFKATIEVDSFANFNSGQFDISFDSSVVNVTGVTDGMLENTTVPVDRWEFVDEDTIRVIIEVSGIAGVSGSGDLAEVSFEVLGESGDKSTLDISEGLLVDTEAEEIPAEWIDDEVIVGPAPAKVEVNAPVAVNAGETFDVSIDVDNITDFNSGQFDLSFDASVVNVTDVADGSLDGATIPVDRWEFVDEDTIRVIIEVSGISGVSGSGYLAEISFEAVGERGDRSILDISDGMLVDTEAEEIPGAWIDDEVTIGLVQVKVDAPTYIEGTFEASINVDNIMDFNSGQFDISFDPSVVNVSDVEDGRMDGATIPVDRWEFIDRSKIRVIIDVPGITGVSGSGNLAKICFDVVGKRGDKSVLDISDGMLVNMEAEEIPVEWIDDGVIVAPIQVSVNAPGYVEEGQSFDVTIDVNNLADFNAGMFDSSFDHSVLTVVDVTEGSINDTAIPIAMWDFVDSNTIKVMPMLSGVTTVSGSGYLAKITFLVKGTDGDESVLDISGELACIEDGTPKEIPTEWINGKVRVGLIFDTGLGTYPSISGRHEGTIEVYDDITVRKLYTYPCKGTGGHTEYVRVWGDGIDKSASWDGYTGDYHNIVFSESFTLKAGKTYNYIIQTGSYPQIHHRDELELEGVGKINCTKFVDANGREHNDWIPAIKLW